MNTQNLVKMANQIGQFFEAEPDQAQAASDVATHMKRFWDPRMRKAIVEYAGKGGEGLLPIVLQAVSANPQLLA
ncbi:MAG: formate dehydrogenase subunit delta [Methylophilaceae bacterium]|jgi:formate dehydrogenase subunit delta